MTKKITMIVGSLRKNSFNQTLANYIKNHLPNGFEAEVADISGLPFFNQDTEFPTPDAVSHFRDSVASADGLWIVSPEYNGTFPGGLKNALDWLSRPTQPDKMGIPAFLLKLPVTISGVGGKAKTAGARTDLIKLTKFMGMDPMQKSVGLQLPMEAFMTDHFELSDQQKVELDQQIRDFTNFINHQN